MLTADELKIVTTKAGRAARHAARQAAEKEAAAKRIDCFADGSYENGVMAIGVYCPDPLIEIHEVIEVGSDPRKSNNIAECLGVIRALAEAQERGLSFRLKSDSQLVVCWTSGSYALRSQTANTYVPSIRMLLDETKSTLSWIPGYKNLADRLSRQHLPQPTTEYGSELERIAGEPIENLRFRDFARLKCGRDRYSAIRLPKLLEGQSVETVASIAGFEDAEKAKVLRWCLRGLPLEKAIRKVNTDLEMSANVQQQYREERI